MVSLYFEQKQRTEIKFKGGQNVQIVHINGNKMNYSLLGMSYINYYAR